MGYMCHHAIIVTTYDDVKAQEAHTKALELGMQVSPVIVSHTNGYLTFLISPDGSKEGWETSDQGDRNRKQFIDWMNSKRYSDNSSALMWVEVQYGDDNGDTRIVSHSDE
jgi:hypothetical protein